jgi:hypothetical protein|tara:strand:- start:358 stop:510 length:153 start_codon:yes stop_codon:yes gene_type:complete
MSKEKYMFSKPKDTKNAGKGSVQRFFTDTDYKENYNKIFRKNKDGNKKRL